ncbi:MAG: dihydroorotase [Planctomycetota bacterium]
MDWKTDSALLLRGGTIATSFGTREADILIRDGKIAEIGSALEAPDARVADVAGLTICPGFVDIHVHLREPGADDSETLESGLDAAAVGGIHHLYCMANTDPVNDSAEQTAGLIEKARGLSPLELHPVAAVTRGLIGDDLTNFEELVQAGAGAFSNDGLPVENVKVLERALEKAAELSRTVLVHAEDRKWSGGAVDVRAAKRLGTKGIHVEAEDLATARDVGAAMDTNASVHVCHVSTAGSVEIVRGARAAGGRISAEATPHHLLLTYDDIPEGDTNYKMSPPLRAPSDVEALIGGILDGTVTAIATDHAPHSPARKDYPLDEAPFGAIGLETSFAVSHTALVAAGHIGLEGLLSLMVDGPAEIAGISPPRIEVGAPAELNLLDLSVSWSVAANDLASRSRNCPFLGRRLEGRVVGAVHGTQAFRRVARSV